MLTPDIDVLYAQNSLSETEIGLLFSKRDRYLAQAILLRHTGRLETDRLLVDGPRYDPDSYLNRVRQRSAVPWGGVIRTIDALGAPGGKPQAIEKPETATGAGFASAPTSRAPNELLRGAYPENSTSAPVQRPRP